MSENRNAKCRACQQAFSFDPAVRTFPTPSGTAVVPHRL